MEAMDIDSAAITIPVIDTSSIGTNAVSVNQSNNNANRLHNSGSSSSSISSNSSGYGGSTTTTPTNNYESQSAPTTPVAIAEPLPNTTIATVTPFINEAVQTKVFNQLQEQQQTLQQHMPHLQKQQLHHHHHYHHQYKQHQSPLTPAPLPTRQQYYNAYDYHQQQTHNLAPTQAVGASPSFAVGSGVESYDNMLSYAGAASYKKSSEINYEREANLKSTQTLYDNKTMANGQQQQQQQQHQQQFVGISNIQEKQGHFLNQRSSNISLISNTNTNNSHKPQAAATPFYAQPFAQQYGCSSYYDNFHTKVPMTLSEYHENYDQSYQQHKFYAAAKTQIKEAAGLTKPYATGSHTAQSFYNSNTTNHALTPPAYDKYLYSPNSLSAGGYNTNRVGNETPPEAKAYRKNSGNSSGWQWPLDNVIANSRPLPPSSALQQPPMPNVGHIPTATVAPTHAASYLASNPTSLQREATYYYRNTTAAYQSPSLVHPNYQPQPYMSPPSANRNLWHTSHALHNERLSHAVPQNGSEATGPSHVTMHTTPYFPTNTSIVSNNRQSCCSQGFSPQNCYYPSRLTVPPPPPTALRSATTYMPSQQASSQHLTSLGSSCKYGSVQDFTVSNKVKNPTDLFIGPTNYETQPSHGLHAHNYNYSSSVNGNFFSPSNHHQSTLTTGFNGPAMTQNQSVHPNDLNFPPNNFSNYLSSPLNRDTSYMNNHNMEIPQPTFGSTSAKSALLDYRKHLQTPSQSQHQPQSLVTDDYYYNASRDHNQSADSSKALGNGETSLFQFDIEQQGTVNITFNPSNEVASPYVSEDKTSCDDVNKNLSLRDFIANWNDDEEDCAANEQIMANNSNHFVTKPTESADSHITIPQELENSKKPPPGKSVNEEKKSPDNGLLLGNITTDLDATNQYVNLPDIIIDIEKSTNTINNLHPDNSKLQLNLDNFDVEQELDQLQLRKYGNSTHDTESTMAFSENCDVALTEKATHLKVNDNEQHLSKDLSVNTREVTHTVLSPALTRPLSNDIEHSVEQQFLNDIESYDGSNSHHSNESAFEKEYETFINRISSEIIAKEFKRQDASDQEFEQNVKDFSKFHKRKRKLKQVEDEDMKEEQISKQQKIHPQPETENNSNFPQVYTRKSRFRKSRKNILYRKRKPSSIFYRLMHPLKRSFHFYNTKPSIRHYLNELTDKNLPLTKKKSPKPLSLGAVKTRNKPNSLKILCIMAINTDKFRATLVKSANSKLNEMTVPLSENVQNSFDSVYQSETINSYAVDEEHICTDPHCETCEVIKSLMEPQSYEFDVQTSQNLSDSVHNCDIEPIDLSSESCFRESLKTNPQIPNGNENSTNQNSQNFSESNTIAELTEANIRSEVHEPIIETQNLVKINNATGNTSNFLGLNEDHDHEVAEDEKQPELSYLPYKIEQGIKDEKSEVTDEHSALLSEIGISKGEGVTEESICKKNQQTRTKYYQATSFLNLGKKLQSSDGSNETSFEECKTSTANAENNQTDFASNIGNVVSTTNLKSPSLHEQAITSQSFDAPDKKLYEPEHSQDSYQFVREKDSKKTQQKLEDNIAAGNYCKDGENSKDKESNGSLNHRSPLRISNVCVYPVEKQHFNLHLERIDESEKISSFNESEHNTSKVANDYCDSRLRIPDHRMENYEKIVDNTNEEMESESDSEQTNSDTESESSTSRTSDSENDSSCSSVSSSDTCQRIHDHQVVARDESVKKQFANGEKDQTQVALIKSGKYSDIHPEVEIHSEADIKAENNDKPSNIVTSKEYNLSHPIENDDDSIVSDAIDDNAKLPIIIDHPGSLEHMEEKDDNDGINVTVGGKENLCHSNESNCNHSPYAAIRAEDSNQKLINKNEINDCKESDNELNFESNNEQLNIITIKEGNLPQYVKRESDFLSRVRSVDLIQDNIMSYSESEALKFQTIKEDTLPQPIKNDDDRLSACDALYNEGNILIKDKLSKDWEIESDDDESYANNMSRSMESADNASLRNSTHNQDVLENKSPRPVDEPMHNESIYTESKWNECQKNNLCQSVASNDDSNQNQQCNEQQNTTTHLRSENGIEYETTSSRVSISPAHVSKQSYATCEQNKPENVLENTERESNKTMGAKTNSQANYEKVNSHNCDKINIDASSDFNLLQCGKNYNDSTACVSVYNEKTCQSLTKECDLLTSNDSNEESESESSSEYSSSDEDEDVETANKDLNDHKTFSHDLPEDTNSKSNNTDCQNVILKSDCAQHSIENEEVKSPNILLQTIEINGKSLRDINAKEIENEGRGKALKFNNYDDASSDVSSHGDSKSFPSSKENETLQEQAENVTSLADKCEESENRENKLNASAFIESEKDREEVCVHFSENYPNNTKFGESFRDTTEYAKDLQEQCNIQSQVSYAEMPSKEMPEMAKASVLFRDHIQEDHNEILSYSTETEKNMTLKILNNDLLDEISLSQVKPSLKAAGELRNIVGCNEVSENISKVSREQDHAMKNEDETSVMELTEKDMINGRKANLVEIRKELLSDDGNEAIEQNLRTRNESDTGLQYKDKETNETISKWKNSEKNEGTQLHSYIKSGNEFSLSQNADRSRFALSEEKTTNHKNENENKSQDNASTVINLGHLLQDNNRGQEDSGSNESMIEDFRGFSEEKCFEEESQDFRGFDDKTSSNSIHTMNLDENAALSNSSESTVSSSRSFHSFYATKFLHSNFKTSISSEINELEALEKELSHRDWNLQNDEDQEKHMKNEINSQLIVNDNDMENIKKILQGDEIAPNESEQTNADTAFVSKLSDLCRAALNSSLHLPNVCTTIESNPIDDENEVENDSKEMLLNRELTVEEALADMYRQAGILSDSEDSANEQELGDESKDLDDKTAETQDVILINLQEILNSDNDIYVLQCDLNENILNIMETSNTSSPIQEHQQTEHIDENNAERVDTLLAATQNESEIHIISSDSECEEVILLSDEGETETIPFITDHNLLDENVSLIHHEEIVPDNYKEFLREEFFKYLHEKYVQKNISKYYHANRILRKYKKRYSKQKK
ncbi:uncharacterized protein ACN427_000126 isoform 1-T11 [Glossina fuscipes fuscipes]